MNVLTNESNEIHMKHLQINERSKIDLNICDFINRDYTVSILYRENKVYDDKG